MWRPPLHLGVVAIEKGSLLVTLDYGRQLISQIISFLFVSQRHPPPQVYASQVITSIEVASSISGPGNMQSQEESENSVEKHTTECNQRQKMVGV